MTKEETFVFIFSVSTGALLIYVITDLSKKVNRVYDYIKKQRTDVDKIGDYMYQRAKNSGNMCSFSFDLDDELSERVGVDKYSKAAIIVSELKRAYYPDQEQNAGQNIRKESKNKVPNDIGYNLQPCSVEKSCQEAKLQGIAEAKKDLDILEKAIFNLVSEHEKNHSTYIGHISLIEIDGIADNEPKTVGVSCKRGTFSRDSKNLSHELSDQEIVEAYILKEVKRFEDKHLIRITDIQSHSLEHSNETERIRCTTSLRYTA